jgi:DNA-binding CsgD family transcriptional regulator
VDIPVSGAAGYATDTAALTPRMRDVARCGAAGCSVEQTARQLGVSPETVKTVRARLCARVDAPNFTAAVVIVVRLGEL